MVIVGLLVGTFEPARVTVAIAQTASASAVPNTAPPTQRAGTAAGMNGRGMSQCRANAASTASIHAIGGRMMTLAVSAASFMASLVNLRPCPCKRFCIAPTGALEYLHGNTNRRMHSLTQGGMTRIVVFVTDNSMHWYFLLLLIFEAE